MCADGEVVVMTEARYGRMAIGRCVRTDYGYVGCWVNVLGYLDSTCSGRRSCEMRIPDQGLKVAIAASQDGCPREFKTYLNASYDCYEGIAVTIDRLGFFADTPTIRWSFRKTRTVGTLASEAELGV